MRVGDLLVVGVLLAIAASPATGRIQDAPTDPKTGIIRGRITAGDTGRPLRRARVTIMSAAEGDRTAPITAHTSSLGQFEARNVPAGTYYVAASRAGYLQVEYGQQRVGERGLTVDVGSGETVERIDLALPRGGVLSGRVTDELGEPYPGVRVDALSLRYQRGQRNPFPAGVATTDDLGQFRIAGLRPGSYHVVASSTETWKTEKGETFGYASTYYPGGPPDQAQLVTLGLSERRTDLNFSLEAGRAARITGRLQRENGEPVAGGQVSLAYGYPGVVMSAGMRLVRTERDGSFEFKDVAGGTYAIGPEMMITVAGADIADLVLVSRTGSIVSGTLATEDGTPPPFGSSGVRILVEAPTGNVLPTVRVVAVERNWSFKFTNLGGPFLFRVIGLPDGWMLGRVQLNDKDITDAPWDVPTGGKEFTGLRVTVTDRVGRLSGAVVDSSGRPASDATVVVFPDDPDRWFPYSRFIRATRPGADGRFSIAGLPAGAYRAIAREYVENGQWEDRRFLEEVRGEGVRFELAEGGSEEITLKLPASR
jgi:hypothetical protein